MNLFNITFIGINGAMIGDPWYDRVQVPAKGDTVYLEDGPPGSYYTVNAVVWQKNTDVFISVTKTSEPPFMIRYSEYNQH